MNMQKKRKTIAAVILAAAMIPALAKEKPWTNTTVVGAIQGCNPRLEDDFYAAINRDRLLAAKIPQGYSKTNSIVQRTLQVNEELAGLMTNKSLQGPDARNVQNLYDLFLDWESRKGGTEEMKKIVGRIQSIKSVKDMADWLCGQDCLYNGTNFCDLYIGADLANSSKSALTIYSTDLTLDDSAEYKTLSENGKNEKEFCDALSNFVLKKLGYDDARAKEIVAQKYQFEKELAASMMTEEECNSPDYMKKTLNKKTVAELQALSPNFPLVQTMKLRGMDKAKTIYLAEPEWLKKLNELFTETNLELIKAYVIDTTARKNAGLFDKETYDFYKAARNKRMGIAISKTYEQDACDCVAGAMPVPLSKLYAKHCVDKNAKARVTKIIKRTIEQYKKIIASQDWLCDATKKKAVEKVAATKIHVAYPAFWDDWSALKILSAKEGEIFFSAVEKIRFFYIQQSNKKVNKNHGSGMWMANIFQANAFNNWTNNSINIIAGIIGGDFYRPDMKDEELYGALGAVIGHEISHSFDARGSQFDKNGSMKNWWTQEDYAAFEKRSQKIAGYFDSMNTLGDAHQSGKTVQGEAAADIGGIKVMLELAKENPNFDYKLFFESYAHLWASLCQKEYADMSLKSDTHPFDFLRVNVTLQQFDEFYKTYNIKPGDGMYLAPEKRIGIW